MKCFKKWRIYFEKIKHKIQIYTNHKNLLCFTTTKVLDRKQIRWSEKLFKHNFIILYRKKDNEKIDALNRWSNYFEKNETINETILKQFKGKIVYNHEYFMTTNRIERDTFLNRIREITKRDELIKNWFEQQSEKMTIQDEILHFEKLMYVSVKIRQKVIKKHHESRIYEHLESSKLWNTFAEIIIA